MPIVVQHQPSFRTAGRAAFYAGHGKRTEEDRRFAEKMRLERMRIRAGTAARRAAEAGTQRRYQAGLEFQERTQEKRSLQQTYLAQKVRKGKEEDVARVGFDDMLATVSKGLLTLKEKGASVSPAYLRTMEVAEKEMFKARADENLTWRQRYALGAKIIEQIPTRPPLSKQPTLEDQFNQQVYEAEDGTRYTKDQNGTWRELKSSAADAKMKANDDLWKQAAAIAAAQAKSHLEPKLVSSEAIAKVFDELKKQRDSREAAVQPPARPTPPASAQPPPPPGGSISYTVPPEQEEAAGERARAAGVPEPTPEWWRDAMLNRQPLAAGGAEDRDAVVKAAMATAEEVVRARRAGTANAEAQKKAQAFMAQLVAGYEATKDPLILVAIRRLRKLLGG